jgi:hypothetical protein
LKLSWKRLRNQGLNFLRMEGILRKLQKVMKLTQMWKDFENNGTT